VTPLLRIPKQWRRAFELNEDGTGGQTEAELLVHQHQHQRPSRPDPHRRFRQDSQHRVLRPTSMRPLTWPEGLVKR